MSLKDMRDELRDLRKTSGMRPVSKMKKMEIALELEKLRGHREETAPVASTSASKSKRMEGKIKDVKVAKEKEFPVAPVAEKKASKKVAMVKETKAEGESKMSKKDMLKAMLDEMED